jgi:hypothetical protein|tara:strand:+ start:56 stop:280 length:225 start_codon:yes stop_codon:yes gene_type:complete
MHVNIWVGKDWLDQVFKITRQEIADDDVFDNAVEYTDIAMIPGQIQVSIGFDKYTNLVDRGLLVDWAGAETLIE